MLACLCGGLGLAGIVASAYAGDMTLTSEITGSTAFHVPVKSFKELKFVHTLHQQVDYSCGAAAIATLLTYSYGKPVAERTVLQDMLDHGDKQVIQTKGFSLLDIRNYLARQGLQSGGYRLPLDKIPEVAVPGIVLINHNGYNHFVVVDGFKDGRLLLADPSLGARTVDVDTFKREWTGVYFVILTGADDARRKFNLKEDWSLQGHGTWDRFRDTFDLARLSFKSADAF
jgi:predicted double-glycine peptidase